MIHQPYIIHLRASLPSAGGWPEGTARGRYLKRSPLSRNRVYDSPRHQDVEGRRPFHEVQEGDIATGRIVSIMQYAGLLVRCLCQGSGEVYLLGRGAVAGGTLNEGDGVRSHNFLAMPPTI